MSHIWWADGFTVFKEHQKLEGYSRNVEVKISLNHKIALRMLRQKMC